jgi:hypothetical protein
MLLNFVPVSLLDTASEICASTFENAPWPIVPLLVRRRVIIDEHALSLQVQAFFVACISQEKRLVTVSDKHKCITRDL